MQDQSYFSRTNTIVFIITIIIHKTTMISTLQQKVKSSFSTLSSLLSPIERMTLATIQNNFLRNITSKQTVNNIKIGINCTSIALKYSKCYLCKFPVINHAIRSMNKMQFIDDSISQTSQRIFQDFPEEMKVLRKLGKYFKYQNKNLYSSFALLFTESLSGEARNKALNFLTAVESITLGFELHHNIGTNYRPNTLVQIGLKIIQKVIKDKYLVLAGDYFHIKASVLGSETKNISVSKLLAEIEINLCKCVYLQEQLKKKINDNGYGSISVGDIHEINALQAKQIAQGLVGLDMIKSIPITPQSQEIYNCIGLMVLYRKELENFMFNFYQIFANYLQYTKNITINFCDQYTLTNYIFYQSAQQNQRIDLAYLNTVQMMSSQIQYLEMRLKNLLKQEQYEETMRKINYIMMVHS